MAEIDDTCLSGESIAVESQKKNGLRRKTEAAIIIVGDEILKGHCKDTNAAFLLSHLWLSGVSVRKVSFISDNVEEIAREVSYFSSKFSFVITTGGIGPTHDDVTFAGIAKAFNEDLVLNHDLKEMIAVFTDGNISSAHLKMAMVPQSTNLKLGVDPVTGAPMKFPLLSVNNVFIFPGIPEYLEKLFLVHKHQFRGSSEFLLTKIYLSTEEEKIAGVIENVSKMYPDVHVGSYPMLNYSYKIKITLESEDEGSLRSAYNTMIEKIPSDVVVSVKKCLPNSRTKPDVLSSGEVRRSFKRHVSINQEMNSLSLLDLEHYLSSNNTSSLSTAIKCAVSVLNQTLQIYSMDEICFGFNGGKDCTAVLHLYVGMMKNMYPDHTGKLKGLYIKQQDAFEEAEDFIDSCQNKYDIEMTTIPGSIRDGLESLAISNPEIKAVIMGTRRHDPYSSKLRAFSMTDADWPEYMRVLPILDWSYSEVWDFLKVFNLPYCSLYDEGYTSLGARMNTEKNPALRKSDGTYSPAYTLLDEFMERSGRDKK